MTLRFPDRRLTAMALLIAVALGAAGGCGGGVRGGGVGGRILLVGIDSADWDVIDPMIADGRLPNLASLIESGVSCDLHSLEPKQKSPTIWATIATGKFPDKHGITDYLDPSTRNLMTSNMRTARPFWDILGEDGRSVTVVGWLVSWPAEQVNGYMVTDYFRYPPRDDRPLPEHLTYPDGLLDEVTPLRVVADDVTDDELERFIDLNAAMKAEEAQRLPVDKMFMEMRAINELSGMAASLKDIIAGDRTFLGVTRRLMREHPTELSVVYLRGVDTASHRFWASAHRGEVGFPVSETESRVFGQTVARYYEYADEMLGELVGSFGDGTIMVCSDHGFEGPKPGQLPGGINDHGLIGILVMSGPAFRNGVRISERSVQDITPTILALCGLPVGEDMDGSVINDAFTQSFLTDNPISHIPTYERGKP
ncbi:MAG: alkaline phosphatase family protein [Candidatus Eisenbacteria bacterium]|nr:alkaline phosphatase family protein [Candidatus Eisenbacteria bacterium]